MGSPVDPLIALSALLYASAFLFPVACHWCVFVWLIPLYGYSITHPNRSARCYAAQGFWWGALFFLLHMHALIYMLVQQAPLTSACVVSMLLILYSCLVSACWFAGAAWCARRMASWHRLCIWVLATNLYIYLVDTLFFRCICLPRGYVFAYPLLPLAQGDCWSWALGHVPHALLVLCLCVGSACLAQGLWRSQQRMWCLMTAAIFFAPFCVGFFVRRQPSACAYEQRCVYAQPPAYHKQMIDVQPLAVACAINEQICRAVRLFPQASCILFPESTFPFALDLRDDVRQLWIDNVLWHVPDVTVVIGSHHSCGVSGEERMNTLFCLRDRHIGQTYDKKTRLPFAEYMPWPWSASRLFSEFLLKNKKIFHAPDAVDRQDHTIYLALEMPVAPYICSDLFFNCPRPDDQADTILWLVNDSWFVAYWRQLMFLYARLQAQRYGRTILYIAHEFGACIRPNVPVCYLPSVMIPKAVN